MKRYYRFFSIFLTVLTIWGIGLQSIDASNNALIPQYIEVGLHFGPSAKATANLKASRGFLVGKYVGDDFNEFMHLSNHNEIILRKDAYFIGSGGNFVEFTGDINRVGNLNLQGPYHVQIGDTFNTIEAAFSFIMELQLKDTPYLVLDNGWRVYTGLYISEAIAKERAVEIRNKTSHNTNVIPPSNHLVQVMDNQGNPIFMFNSNEGVYFKGGSENGEIPIINYEGNRFRGTITAKRMTNNDMAIINRLNLDEYLYGVVPREMPASWPLEALKAQAVSARSFAIASMNKFAHMGFNLCNTVNSQVYGGFDAEHPNTNRAVDETRGMVITHNGIIIRTFYHSNSGGHTEDSENIWVTQLPYVRGVEDKFSLDAPNSTWTVVMTPEEVKEALLRHNIDVGDVISIDITSLSRNGRVLSLTVRGTRGQEIMERQRSRIVFGLRSTWFKVVQGGESIGYVKNAEDNAVAMNLQGKYVISAGGVKRIDATTGMVVSNGTTTTRIASKAEGFIFDGRGFGHGVGMSQHGARRMAELNFTFQEILMHYYTDIEVIRK